MKVVQKEDKSDMNHADLSEISNNLHYIMWEWFV